MYAGERVLAFNEITDSTPSINLTHGFLNKGITGKGDLL